MFSLAFDILSNSVAWLFLQLLQIFPANLAFAVLVLINSGFFLLGYCSVSIIRTGTIGIEWNSSLDRGAKIRMYGYALFGFAIAYFVLHAVTLPNLYNQPSPSLVTGVVWRIEYLLETIGILTPFPQ